jgi:hypothetical protein
MEKPTMRFFHGKSGRSRKRARRYFMLANLETFLRNISAKTYLEEIHLYFAIKIKCVAERLGVDLSQK